MKLRSGLASSERLVMWHFDAFHTYPLSHLGRIKIVRVVPFGLGRAPLPTKSLAAEPTHGCLLRASCSDIRSSGVPAAIGSLLWCNVDTEV